MCDKSIYIYIFLIFAFKMFKKYKVLDPDILDLAGSGSATPLQTVARVKRGEINRIKTVHLQISIFGGFLLVLR